jgi:uncharacterized membrane protein YjjP (DUF1212 family)
VNRNRRIKYYAWGGILLNTIIGGFFARLAGAPIWAVAIIGVIAVAAVIILEVAEAKANREG